MAISRPFNRDFFLLGGAVKTTGGDDNLVKGQAALVDSSKALKDGAKILGSVAGFPKDQKTLQLRVGTSDKGGSRSFSTKSQSTQPFSLSEIVGLSVSAPEKTEQSVDEVILGYDGVNEDTAFDFKVGDSYFSVAVELSGSPIAFKGGGSDKEVINVTIDIPRNNPFDCNSPLNDCDPVDAKVVVEEAVEQLRRRQITGGNPVSDYVDITPVIECDTPAVLTEVDYNFYELTVCDTGAEEALALVAAQYDVPVVRIARKGADSTYQLMIPAAAGAPADYSQNIASILKGCDTCPAGYTEVPGGVVMALSIEDDGADLTAAVQAIAGAAAGTAKKSGNAAGIGFYTVVLDDEMTDAEKAAFVTANASAEIKSLGKVEALCANATVTDTAWVAGEVCKTVEETYEITLADTACGESRLAEIQANYPDLVVTEVAASEAACQRKYSVNVTSNVVCEECSPIFKDFYMTEKPERFDEREWELIVDPLAVPSGNCKTGIRIKAKEFILDAEEALREDINFLESAVLIRAAADFPEEVREGIGRLPKGQYEAVYLSKWAPRTHLGGNLRIKEDQSRAFFSDNYNSRDYLFKQLTGNTSVIEDSNAQYVDYALEVSHKKFAGGLGHVHTDSIIYHIFVEVGRHEGIEAILNDLAANAGVNTVQAFGA